MTYKRYDGFYANGLQQKIDSNLMICPFCGDNPHWLLNIQTGFTKNSTTCMCDKCGAKLNFESNGFGWDDNMRVVDLGNKNINNLALNANYHIQALNSLGSSAKKCVDGTSEFSSVSNIKNTVISSPSVTTTAVTQKKWIVAAVTFIVALAIILAIILGTRGCSSSVNYLTYDNYVKIQNGMSYSEVVEILEGHQGQLNTEGGYGGYTLKYYTWTNSSGTRCIVVGFENNKVCAKSQYGL